jgi:hypothetical protein
MENTEIFTKFYKNSEVLFKHTKHGLIAGRVVDAIHTKCPITNDKITLITVRFIGDGGDIYQTAVRLTNIVAYLQ